MTTITKIMCPACKTLIGLHHSGGEYCYPRWGAAWNDLFVPECMNENGEVFCSDNCRTKHEAKFAEEAE